MFFASSIHSIETIGMPAFVAAEKFFSWPFLSWGTKGTRVPRCKGTRLHEVQDTRYNVNMMTRLLYLKTKCVTPFLTLSHTSAPRLLARLFRQPPVFSALSSDLHGSFVNIEVKMIEVKMIEVRMIEVKMIEVKMIDIKMIEIKMIDIKMIT